MNYFPAHFVLCTVSCSGVTSELNWSLYRRVWWASLTILIPAACHTDWQRFAHFHLHACYILFQCITSYSSAFLLLCSWEFAVIVQLNCDKCAVLLIILWCFAGHCNLRIGSFQLLLTWKAHLIVALPAFPRIVASLVMASPPSDHVCLCTIRSPKLFLHTACALLLVVHMFFPMCGYSYPSMSAFILLNDLLFIAL